MQRVVAGSQTRSASSDGAVAGEDRLVQCSDGAVAGENVAMVSMAEMSETTVAEMADLTDGAIGGGSAAKALVGRELQPFMFGDDDTS